MALTGSSLPDGGRRFGHRRKSLARLAQSGEPPSEFAPGGLQARNAPSGASWVGAGWTDGAGRSPGWLRRRGRLRRRTRKIFSRLWQMQTSAHSAPDF